MKITLIGSGNVATVLGHLAKDRGHNVVQVYSRQLANAEELADVLNANATNDFSQLVLDSDVYISALNDSALNSLHKHIMLRKGLLVHTAGAISINALKNAAVNYGVLYPLQSLRKEKLDYEPFPLLVDANTTDNLTLISDFAQSLSPEVKHANDTERLQLHLAAVMVNNFTNHLYALAQAFCVKQDISFELLKPLIVETANRVHEFDPALMQTGPARRGDETTLLAHLDLLKNSPELKLMYNLFSESIKQFYKP